MHYVYILSSLSFPNNIYIGVTQDVEKRLQVHNNGDSTYTAKYIPWNIIFYGAFTTKQKAIAFEKFLKTGSGRAFINAKLI